MALHTNESDNFAHYFFFLQIKISISFQIGSNIFAGDLSQKMAHSE